MNFLKVKEKSAAGQHVYSTTRPQWRGALGIFNIKKEKRCKDVTYT
jgi:hypothetical protein